MYRIPPLNSANCNFAKSPLRSTTPEPIQNAPDAVKIIPLTVTDRASCGSNHHGRNEHENKIIAVSANPFGARSRPRSVARSNRNHRGIFIAARLKESTDLAIQISGALHLRVTPRARAPGDVA